MSISIIDGFLVSSAKPADVKSIASTTASLYTSSNVGFISSSWRYDGMSVYCQDTKEEYNLIGGITDSNWVKVSINGKSISSSFSNTASYVVNAQTSSYINSTNINGTVTSASYALSSSAATSITFIPNLSNTASYVSASNVGGNVATSSWAIYNVSASVNSTTANANYYIDLSPATSGQQPTYVGTGIVFNPSTNQLSGSNLGITASLNGTSSWSNNSSTASYVNSSNISGTVTSASYSITSSYASNISPTITASYSTTASYYKLPYAIKSGKIASQSFSGTPLTSDVTFATAYPDTNYAVNVIGGDARLWTLENVSSSNFTISTNSTTALTDYVYWTSIANGESV
jgi:hypothetical protein